MCETGDAGRLAAQRALRGRAGRPARRKRRGGRGPPGGGARGGDGSGARTRARAWRTWSSSPASSTHALQGAWPARHGRHDLTPAARRRGGRGRVDRAQAPGLSSARPERAPAGAPRGGRVRAVHSGALPAGGPAPTTGPPLSQPCAHAPSTQPERISSDAAATRLVRVCWSPGQAGSCLSSESVTFSVPGRAPFSSVQVAETAPAAAVALPGQGPPGTGAPCTLRDTLGAPGVGRVAWSRRWGRARHGEARVGVAGLVAERARSHSDTAPPDTPANSSPPQRRAARRRRQSPSARAPRERTLPEGEALAGAAVAEQRSVRRAAVLAPARVEALQRPQAQQGPARRPGDAAAAAAAARPAPGQGS
jgi:hypothetical protein